MQYLVSVIFDAPDMATPDEMAAIDGFNDRLKAEGHWVFAGGLGAPNSATVIDNRGEQPLITDGPFLESKEFLAGFWIMEPPTSTWRSSSPPRDRKPAIGRSRCGRSCNRNRRPGGDRPGSPRAVGAGSRHP
jgi:hypothetical protein